MNWKKEWEKWKNHSHSFSYITDDLEQLTEDQAKEQFKKHLDFGTGGARGTFGAGTNRINHFTIRRLAEGLRMYLNSVAKHPGGKSIAVGYDTRYFSKEFAEDVAYIFASQGYKVYLSDDARPTPILSYMIRHYETSGGVMITASHNPPNYNGFKIYDHTGGQMTEDMAKTITIKLSEVKDELSLPSGSIDDLVTNGQIVKVGDDLDQSYLKELIDDLRSPDLFKQRDNLSVVYSPLHGTGLKIVNKAMQLLNFENLYIVEEQTTTTGQFETVLYPNPEEKEAFAQAERLGKKVGADLIMATDPDADRLGVAIDDGTDYRYLSGNQLGAVLLNYLIETSGEDTLNNAVLIKTVVTSDLGAQIAHHHGIDVINTLTGFKYIGEKITEFEETGHKQFLFGYEESYGYLFSSLVRDKDAIQAVVLLIEAALYYQSKNLTLLDVLESIYKQYGYYSEELTTITVDSEEKEKQVLNKVNDFKKDIPSQIGPFEVSHVEDYLKRERTAISDYTVSPIQLPESNVLKLIFKDQSWVAIRPSGTEPKFKIYLSSNGATQEESNNKLKNLRDTILSMLFPD